MDASRTALTRAVANVCDLPAASQTDGSSDEDDGSYGTYEDIISFLMIAIGGVYFLLVSRHSTPD